MKAVFADTFYYIALLDANDSAHEAAVDVTRQLKFPIVTTGFVLLELANALSASRHRGVFGSFLHMLRANSSVIIHEADKELFDLCVEVYRRREDKNWSLTDCISFVVASRGSHRSAHRRPSFSAGRFQDLTLLRRDPSLLR